MSIKHKLMPHFARLITSEGLQQWRRRLLEWRRKLKRQPHQATFYFRIDDPYSVPVSYTHLTLPTTPYV